MSFRAAYTGDTARALQQTPATSEVTETDLALLPAPVKTARHG